MPRVSVILPNYNHSIFLKQRIDSIMNQTYQCFELIILDDCSTDNSKEILLEYKNHPKVSQIIFNNENSGSTFKQWQKGIDLSEGEYIWIAESDDWCEPTLLETLVLKLELDRSIVLGYVQSYFVVENEIKWVSKQDNLALVIDGFSFIKEKLLHENSIFNASMAVFRKSAFFKIDDEYVNFKFCGDWLFWGLIASNGSVFISGKILNYFRNHSCDVSSKSYKSGLNYLEDIDVLKYFNDKGYIDVFDLNSALYNKYNIFVKDKYRLPKDKADEIQKKFESHIKLEIYSQKRSELKHRFKFLLRCLKVIK